MLRRGICTEEEYMRAGPRRRYSNARASYTLLDVGDNPTDEQIRAFEEISSGLRLSNGTFRKSFRGRFRDVDEAAMRWMERLYPAGGELRIEDRAVSHGLTSLEWAERVFAVFPRARFEASDILFFLVRLSIEGGETYIAQPDGTPLQYIRPPWVVILQHREALRYPLNHLIAAWARWRFRRLSLPAGWMESAGGSGYRVSRISCIHPWALAFARKNPQFQFRKRSVFDSTAASCHVLRTMNIFNDSYFPAAQRAAGVKAVFGSLLPGGLWIVGRTLEEDCSNHATLLRRGERGWEVLERIGAGSDMEELALR